MATFFMFGSYDSESVKAISLKRTEMAIDAIIQLGGEVNGIYALLGEYDILMCINLPDVQTAMQASIKLAKLTGISFKTSPAVKVSTFDRLAGE